MNFFEQQDRMKRRTGVLIFYFTVGVILIVAAVNAAVALSYQATAEMPGPLPFEVYVGVTLLTLAVIGVSTAVGVYQMSEGGGAVARKLGARIIPPDTKHPDEIKLRNVVEEMAIASGIPVPEIYVFEGPEINAFAAGVRPEEAAVAVSEGAIKTLTREELQGVVAHEFSHIFNGDMRLNIRLIGILNGILMLAIIGRVLMRTRGRKSPLPLLGLGLFVIGYAGVFMARAIKSAVSRQREFLADASAVQFTRNPNGLVSAFKKIAGGTSLVPNPHAEELSHFFFAKGTRSMLDGIFDTHPPIEERIRAIDSSHTFGSPLRSREPASKPRFSTRPGVSQFAGANPVPVGSAPVGPAAAVQTAATVSAPDLALASQLREAIPAHVQEDLLNSQKAEWVVAGLLLSGEENTRAHQRQILEGFGKEALASAEKVEQHLKDNPHPVRLPLVEMAIPSLRRLSNNERMIFLRLVQDLVRADNRVSPFEFAVHVLLTKTLLPQEAPLGEGNEKADSICLLSYLAYAGHPGQEGAQGAAFKKGLSKLNELEGKAILPWDHCGPDAARAALARLAKIPPRKKEILVTALAALIFADGTVTPDEWEIFRAVSQCLEVPTPLQPPDTAFFQKSQS